MSIYLNVAPCAYNGCKFCSYNRITEFKIPTKKELAELIDGEIEKIDVGKQTYVKIFNGGSWFWNEVPIWIKEYVYDYMDVRGYKNLRVENYMDQVKYDEVEALLDRGFKITISWGLEVVDDERLKYIGKNTTVGELTKVFEKTKAMGIDNVVYLLAGLPGIHPDQYVDEFQHSVDWVAGNGHIIDELSALAYAPTKFSSFYKKPWKTNDFRIISAKQWTECREYARKVLNPLSIKTTFTSYNWRYIHGKTYEEAYVKQKQKKNK